MNAAQLDEKLASRGLLDIARSADWKPQTITIDGHSRAGWGYPIYNIQGQPYKQLRWKSADSADHPKYFWPHGMPERAKYYFLPGTLSAIQERNGEAWLGGGEPDVLAYHAGGIKNSFCWLSGEGSPPATLADDLAHMGVTLLFYVPNRDFAGMMSAYKVQQMLEGQRVELIILQLPFEMNSKQDVNDWWMQCRFNADEFKRGLLALPGIDPVELYLYGQQPIRNKEHAAKNVEAQVHAWRDKWLTLIREALGQPDKREGHTDRWLCPLPGHDEVHPSFSIATRQNSDFPWPMCTCEIQKYPDAWEQVADALNVESWEDYKRRMASDQGYQQRPMKQQVLSDAPNGSPQLPVKPLYVVNETVYRDLITELRGERSSDVVPIRFPLCVLHRFGGFAKFFWPKKLVAVTGISGGGKTLLLMTMALKLLMDGFDVLWWGPEWDAEEYGLQDLQRAGGLTMEQIAEWRVYQALKAAGASDSELAGLTIPSSAAIKRSIAILEQLANRQGKLIFLPDPRAQVDDVLTTAGAVVDVRRKEGRRMPVLMWDYAQLSQMDGAHDWTWVERVVGKIKTFCIEKTMAGFVSAQVRKSDSEDVRDGGKLSHAAAQGLSDAQFNLYLTLTPHFAEDKLTMLDVATLGVVKNSMGRRGNVTIPTDFAHLTVLDEEATTIDDEMNQRLEMSESV